MEFLTARRRRGWTPWQRWSVSVRGPTGIALGVLAAAAISLATVSAGAEYQLRHTFFDIPNSSTTKVDVTGYLRSYRGAIKGDEAIFTHRSGKAMAVFARVDSPSSRKAGAKVMNNVVDEYVVDKVTKGKGKREKINKIKTVGLTGTGTFNGQPCKWIAYMYAPKGADAVVAVGTAPAADSAAFTEIKKFVRGVHASR